MKFEHAFEQFMQQQIASEKNGRRRERLERGLGHGETELLRSIWYPLMGNFDHLFPEWEVRDLANGYRYLDIAYMPGDAKGVIEIQGFGSHARDIELWRFNDLCLRHCHLALDGWLIMPISYSLITEKPKLCQQVILSFIGKFVSLGGMPEGLSWLECETLRFARRLLRPFTPVELAAHLRISGRYARLLLHDLVDKKQMIVISGSERVRTYMLQL